MIIKNTKNNYGFTLVEILVSMTIFSIMILSIITIYITASEITMKSDINRVMQENIKNVVEKIAEDVRKNGIKGVEGVLPDNTCDFGSNTYKNGNKLCTKSEEYYLAIYSSITDVYTRVDPTSCSTTSDHCIIYQKNKGPLTNSFVSVKYLNFSVSKDYIPKVTINIIMQPALKKGVKGDLIKNSKMIFQTTISERPF